MDIGGRLRAKIQEREWSTRRFWQEVAAAAPGEKGTSYSSVYAYVEGGKDGTSPPLAFIEAASRVLNVRAAWLAFGDGSESIADEAVRKGLSEPSERPAVRKGLGFTRPSERPADVAFLASPLGEPLLVELIEKLCVAQPPDAPDLSEDQLTIATRAIDRHLVNTWGALGAAGTADRPLGPDSDAGRFVVLSLMAMLSAVPGPHKGRPLAKVLSTLPQGSGDRDHLELNTEQEDIDE